jgi:hypothetical protein
LNGAFNILQEKLCLRAKDMADNEDWHQVAEDDPEELSILSAVMGVTKEVSSFITDTLLLRADVRRQSTANNYTAYTKTVECSTSSVFHPAPLSPNTFPKLKHYAIHPP